MQNVQIAERIKKLCKNSNVTIKQMLEECKLNRNFMYDLKSGSIPSVDKLKEIANYLDCSVDYLIGNIDTKFSSQDLERIEIMDKLYDIFKQLPDGNLIVNDNGLTNYGLKRVEEIVLSKNNE